MKLSDVKTGDVFKIAGIEFIKFLEEDGVATAVAKGLLFDSAFGSNNNFAHSKVLKKLETEILPKIEAEVGAENVLSFETDLLSLDGSDIYGKIKTKISLPTLDFYRQNVKIFDKYKPNRWWWLSTPDSTEEHSNDSWILCVSPSGFINYVYCDCYFSGVRHYLKFLRGDDDEPHNRAFIFNMLGAVWTHVNHPKLRDLPFAWVGAVDESDGCVSCGSYVPEGRQVCGKCERKEDEGK